MKRLTIISLSALLTLAATPDAFAWGAVSGPRGGAAYRGPMGGAAVRTPSGAAAVRTPSGAAVGAAAASTHPSCYYPPYYCYPPAYYQPPAW